MSKSGSKVGIYTTENRWDGPQFKRTGMAGCKGVAGRPHSWYRWQPTGASEVDGEDPWLYWHECSIMGCDAKEYAADLPDLHDVLNLIGFLDQCNVPGNESLLERVREFYNGCNDTLRKYLDRLGELPHIIDPREKPFLAGWEAASLAHGHHHGSLHPGLAPPAFRRWMAEEDKDKKPDA